MQQRERHCASTELQMDARAVRAWANTRRRGLWIQTRCELGVRHRLDSGGIDAERPRVAVDAVDLPGADAHRRRHLPVGQPEHELLPKDLSENVHG